MGKFVRCTGLSANQAVFLLLLIAAGAGYCLPPINPDEGAIFDFSTRMLAGKTLYTDLVDVNPPMIFLLNLLPAALAERVALPIPAIITCCVLALPILSARSLWRFASLPGGTVATTRLVALALIYVLILYPGAEFSQREHLLLLATLPYLVNIHGFIARTEIRSLAARLIEIVPFAVMVTLKPHFALLPLCLESVALLHSFRRTRQWVRLETVILLVWGLACVLGTLLLFPAYLDRILPLAGHYYGIADSGLIRQAFLGEEGRQLLLAISLLILIYAFLLRRLWLALLILCSAALYLVAALQLKDWFYHFLPGHAVALLGLFCCAITLVAERLGNLRAGVARRAMEVAVIPLFIGVSLPEISDSDSETIPPLPYPAQRGFADDGWAKIREIVAEHAEGKTVMWLSQYNDGSSAALAYAHASLVAPTMSLWMLPSLYQTHRARDGEVVFHQPSVMSPDEKWLWKSVSESFFKNAPPVLVDVKDDPGLTPDRFDYVRYFSMNPRFRARLASYRIVYEDNTARVYVRNPGSALMAEMR